VSAWRGSTDAGNGTSWGGAGAFGPFGAGNGLDFGAFAGSFGAGGFGIDGTDGDVAVGAALAAWTGAKNSDVAVNTTIDIIAVTEHEGRRQRGEMIGPRRLKGALKPIFGISCHTNVVQ